MFGRGSCPENVPDTIMVIHQLNLTFKYYNLTANLPPISDADMFQPSYHSNNPEANLYIRS